MDCLFCAINNKEIPAEIIYEDERVTVFKDIQAQAPLHMLTIPKKHISTINDMGEDDKDLLGHMIYTAKTVAAQQGHEQDGYRLVMNCNEQGGQTVYHIHLHMLAGRQMTWPPG
ncbi:histidine triad nucleotide-binding protein [Dasania marina]|uniref:histidine triad nucleotide-binding protein n=1 Tax=Dasania marina TaxID=471499 RepID=UPI0030DAB64C|tara:strand:+ start:97871 stop:98212 length:342 start_codon:yes stop_codon:yes gene_type:complete